MPDIDEINGVDTDNIAKVNGVAKSSVDEFMLGEMPSGEIATRWLIGSTSGKMYHSTQAMPASWSELVDLGGNTHKDVVIGQDNSGNKRWLIHASNNTNELMYVNDSADMTDANNWTAKDFDPNANKNQGTGGPAAAWGNGVWILGGTTSAKTRDSTTYYDGPQRSTDGGANWTKLDVDNTVNDGIKVVAYKGATSNLWFMGIDRYLWKSTNNGASWAQPTGWPIQIESGKDIHCLAYDGTSRWVAALTGDNIWYSDDDCETWTEAGSGAWPGNWGPQCLVYAGGSINKWILGGNNGRLAYSSDGQNWTTIWTGNDSTWSTSHIYDVATDGSTVVIVGASGKIATSTNGTSFTNRSISGVSTTFWSIDCNVIGAGARGGA